MKPTWTKRYVNRPGYPADPSIIEFFNPTPMPALKTSTVSKSIPWSVYTQRNTINSLRNSKDEE